MRSIAGSALPLSAALFVLFALALTTHAQSTKPMVVATVNIYDAKITQQYGNVFAISFDLSNREGAQSGIRFAVELINEQQLTVDEVVYPEVTNLDSNSHVVKNIQYVAPAYLSGTYRLQLVSKNSNSLVLAHATLGSVTLSGSGVYTEIDPKSCYLSISNETGDKRYSLEQGVDIAQSETLNITCAVTNRSSSALTLSPTYETFYRNTFGTTVQTAALAPASVRVNPGETATFTLPLPRPEVPQAYDVKLSFTNAADVPSNSVTAHYVLRGESATIQNMTLDKASYAAGDTAAVSLFWTGPASNFFGARIAPLSLTGARATVSIVNKRGTCGNDVTVTLDPQRSTQVILFPIAAACDSPRVSVSLANDAGEALASSTFDFKNTISSNRASGNILPLTLLALAVLAALYGMVRKLTRHTAEATALVFAAFCLLSYGLPSSAFADTFTQDIYLASSGGWAGNFTVYYDVNLNKSTYAPGETITASGNVTSAACGNSLEGGITATINGVNKDVYRSAFVFGPPGPYHIETVQSSNTFTAQNAPGSYTAEFYPSLYVPSAGPGAGSYFSVDGAGGDANKCSDPDTCPIGGTAAFGGRFGGTMTRSWTGTTPYEIPYTVQGGEQACVSTGYRCAADGNLRDNCGEVRACQYGCSSAGGGTGGSTSAGSQTYSSSGTYTAPTSGQVTIQVIGGGGGGGGNSFNLANIGDSGTVGGSGGSGAATTITGSFGTLTASGGAGAAGGRMSNPPSSGCCSGGRGSSGVTTNRTVTLQAGEQLTVSVGGGGAGGGGGGSTVSGPAGTNGTAGATSAGGQGGVGAPNSCTWYGNGHGGAAQSGGSGGVSSGGGGGAGSSGDNGNYGCAAGSSGGVGVLSQGGSGGKGSVHAKEDEDLQALPGEEKELLLDLKLIADIGLVGFPNSGKSTLISKVSRAHPKIASYPFTTKEPVLGVVSFDEDTSFSIADIPGLIKDSHLGRGLGDRFLRHVERTKVLVHLIDMAGLDARDPIDDYRTINDELKFYSGEVFKKPRILVANKMDLPQAKENLENFQKTVKKKIIPISAKESQGLKELLHAIKKKLYTHSR